MNWIIFSVLAAILLMVPTALFATFACAKDTHQYECHYGESGYSQEVQVLAQPEDSTSKSQRFAANKALAAKNPVRRDSAMIDWPTEL